MKFYSLPIKSLMCKHIVFLLLVITSLSLEVDQQFSDTVLLPKYFLRWILGRYFQKQFLAAQKKDVVLPFQIYDLESQKSSTSKETKLAIQILFAIADQRKGTRSGTWVTFKINKKKF